MHAINDPVGDLIDDLKLSLSKCQDFIKHQQSVINVKDDAITVLNDTLQEYNTIINKNRDIIFRLQTECDRKDDAIDMLKGVIELLNL